MLIRLICFEIRKMIGNRFFLIVFAVLLVVSGILSFGSFEAPGQGRIVVGFMLRSYEALESFTEEERQVFTDELVEIFGERVLHDRVLLMTDMASVDGMSLPSGIPTELTPMEIADAMIVINTENETQTDNLKRIQDAAKAFGRKALQEGDDYEVRRNLNIIRNYRRPRKARTVPIWGWDQFLLETSFTTMIIVLLLTYMMVSGIFSQEKDQKTKILLKTGRNGHGLTELAKYIAAAVCTAVVTLVFMGISLGMFYLNHGLCGGRESVMGIEELAACPFKVTVIGYFLITLLFDVAAAVTLGILFAAVSALSKNSIISFGINIALLGILILPIFVSPSKELFMGPLGILRSEKYLRSYHTANVMKFPVLWCYVHMMIGALAAAGMVVLAHLEEEKWSFRLKN